MILQIIISGITMGCIYAMVGFGFALVFNSSQIMNFAQGEFLMLGAMMHYTGTVVLKLPFIVSLFLSLVTIALVAVLIEALAINPLRKKGASIVMMVCSFISFSIIFKNLAEVIWGKYPLVIQGFFSQEIFNLGNSSIQSQSVAVIGAAVISMFLLWYFFSKTMFGMALVASAFNPKMAHLCGVNVRGMIITSFILSGASSALAGVVVGPISFVSSFIGFDLGIKGFCAAAIGGMGSPVGAIIGGLLLGLLEAVLGVYISTAYSTIMAFIILLVVLYVRPQGILGVSSR
ncbi:MAG: branched-chain amino acid ABC transporter permease [Syntrophorhabdaceae bacterium]|nr:branched-chain amino acid ABC transporter permease [Syntrophorhabdaceae bacterium]